MDFDDGAWDRAAIKKRSRWQLPGWIALVLLISSLSVIGIMRPGRAPAPNLDPGEEVSSFETNIVVLRDGSLSISESTSTNLQGKTARHGISRRLPSLIINTENNELPILYSDQYATIELRDGSLSNPQSIPINSFGNDKNFITYRIGNPDVALLPASYNFVFRFIAQGLIRRFENGDRTGFIWNITGGLVHPIGYTRLLIKLPAFVDPEALRYGAYLGTISGSGDLKRASALSDVSRDVEVTIDRSHDEKDVFATFTAKRPLTSYEHFIVKISWPVGLLDNGM